MEKADRAEEHGCHIYLHEAIKQNIVELKWNGQTPPNR